MGDLGGAEGAGGKQLKMDSAEGRRDGIWAAYYALAAGVIEAIGIPMNASWWDALLPALVYMGAFYGLKNLSRPVCVGMVLMQAVTGLIRWKFMDQDFGENAFLFFAAWMFGAAAWAAIQQGQRGTGWVLVYEVVVVAGCVAVVGRWIWIVTHIRTI